MTYSRPGPARAIHQDGWRDPSRRPSSPRSAEPSTTGAKTTGRTLSLLGSVAVIAVIGAGCSRAPTSSATSSGATGGGVSAAGNLKQAVQFAQCMRSNGVGNFPDPGPSGQFTIDAIANGSGIDTNSTAFGQALNACRNLEPAGFTGSARSAQQQKAALEFARCIRRNGVTDFPDPALDGPLIDTTRIPSAATSAGMAALHAAMLACNSFAASAGVVGRK